MAAQLTKTNPGVIAWAIEESGYDIPTLAEKLGGVGVTESLIEDWTAAKTTPTKGQLTKLAEVLRRQKVVFYMKSPPVVQGPAAELRTARGARARPLGPDERVRVREAMSLQALVSWLSQDAPEYTLPRVEPLSGVDHAANLVLEWLLVEPPDRDSWRDDRQAYRAWKARLEDHGLLVMELQLGKEGVRGFSVFDQYTPLIAVNTAEPTSARSFTLMHEAAHLMARSSASCLSTTHEADYDLERWCDRVAGAVLIPSVLLGALVESRVGVSGLDLVREVATQFRTSLRAGAVALGRWDDRYKPLYAAVERSYPTADRDKGFAQGGRGMTRTERRLRESGKVASGAILGALRDQRISELDARRALDLDGYELDVLDGLLRAHALAID